MSVLPGGHEHGPHGAYRLFKTLAMLMAACLFALLPFLNSPATSDFFGSRTTLVLLDVGLAPGVAYGTWRSLHYRRSGVEPEKLPKRPFDRADYQVLVILAVFCQVVVVKSASQTGPIPVIATDPAWLRFVGAHSLLLASLILTQMSTALVTRTTIKAILEDWTFQGARFSERSKRYILVALPVASCLVVCIYFQAMIAGLAIQLGLLVLLFRWTHAEPAALAGAAWTVLRPPFSRVRPGGRQTIARTRRPRGQS